MSSRPPPPAAPAAPAQVKSPRATIPSAVPLNISSGLVTGADRIVIFGTGGVGKSTLAAHLPAPLFIDVERGTRKLNASRDSASSWSELRGKLATIAAAPPKGLRTVVIDTATVAQELAREHVIATRLTEKGKQVDSIEGYGWGKGWKFVFEEFEALLFDLDRLTDVGLNVCLIVHQVTSPVPNADGEDFIRWEMDLYPGDKKGSASVRERVKNWAEHVLFVRFDFVAEEGKAEGSGTRSIYTQELPTHVAKSRTKQFAMAFDLTNPARAWHELGIV